MSTQKPTMDLRKIISPSAGRRILSEAETQNLDSDSSFVLINDSSNTYMAATFHRDHSIAELWGQPPGMNIAVANDTYVFIWPCNGNDAVMGKTSGEVDYGGGWGVTAENGNVFHFSTMS